jgi:AbrB family looped-hinge helix DNA binding protein
MSIVTVKNNYQVVIPRKIRDQIGVNVGDLLEAKAERGSIVLKPKVVADHDEYTTAQRRQIDAQLANSLAESKAGKTHGPFETHQAMMNFLHEQTKRSPPKSRAKITKRPSR